MSEKKVIPKAYPELESEIVNTEIDFAGEKLYILKNGMRLTKGEFKLKEI